MFQKVKSWVNQTTYIFNNKTQPYMLFILTQDKVTKVTVLSMSRLGSHEWSHMCNYNFHSSWWHDQIYALLWYRGWWGEMRVSSDDSPNLRTTAMCHLLSTPLQFTLCSQILSRLSYGWTFSWTVFNYSFKLVGIVWQHNLCNYRSTYTSIKRYAVDVTVIY